MDAKALSRGLGTAGKRLVAEVCAAFSSLDARQVDALRAAAKLRDRVAELEKIVERDGSVIPKRGAIPATKPKVHPALVEIRQTELVIKKLLAALPKGPW